MGSILRDNVTGVTCSLIGLLALIIFFSWQRHIYGELADVGADEGAKLLSAFGIPEELPYLEPTYTNPYRGMVAMCGAVSEKNQSDPRWDIGAAKKSEKKPEDIQGDDLIKKIRVWAGAKKGAPRILCAVFPHTPAKFDNVKAHKNAWGSKCDKFVVISTTTVPDVSDSDVLLVNPLGGAAADNTWQLIRSAIIRFTNESQWLERFDYFMFSGDDTFIIVENFRKMLMEPTWYHLHQLRVPILAGHRMVQTNSDTPFCAGSAFFINSVGMKTLSMLIETTWCKAGDVKVPEDITLGECWTAAGLTVFDTRDVRGEDRIHLFAPHMIADTIRKPTQTWYNEYRRRPMPKGMDAVSADAVAFHYIDGDQVQQMSKKIYGKS